MPLKVYKRKIPQDFFFFWILILECAKKYQKYLMKSFGQDGKHMVLKRSFSRTASSSEREKILSEFSILIFTLSRHIIKYQYYIEEYSWSKKQGYKDKNKTSKIIWFHCAAQFSPADIANGLCKVWHLPFWNDQKPSV